MVMIFASVPETTDWRRGMLSGVDLEETGSRDARSELGAAEDGDGSGSWRMGSAMACGVGASRVSAGQGVGMGTALGGCCEPGEGVVAVVMLVVARDER